MISLLIIIIFLWLVLVAFPLKCVGTNYKPSTETERQLFEYAENHNRREKYKKKREDYYLNIKEEK